MSKQEIYRVLNNAGVRLFFVTMVAALGGILLILFLIKIITGETIMLL